MAKDEEQKTTPAERRAAEDEAVASGKKTRFMYPEHGVTIVAKDQKTADNMLKEQMKEAKQDG